MAREITRLLVNGGSVVIAHFDWLPISGNVVAATEQIILRYTPTWPFAVALGCIHSGSQTFSLQASPRIESFSFDVSVAYSHEAWVGRVRASAPIAGTLDSRGVRDCSRA